MLELSEGGDLEYKYFIAFFCIHNENIFYILYITRSNKYTTVVTMTIIFLNLRTDKTKIKFKYILILDFQSFMNFIFASKY